MSKEIKITREDFLKRWIPAGLMALGGAFLIRDARASPSARAAEESETSLRQLEESAPRLIMSKNRLYTESGPLPMWFVGRWGVKGDDLIVSGVVAGAPEFRGSRWGRDIDELLYARSGLPTEEITVPIAFQNPTTGETSILNFSIGNRDMVGTTGMVDLTGWQFLRKAGTRGGEDIYRGGSFNHMLTRQELFERLEVGDQIAFSLPITREALYGHLPAQATSDIPEWIRNGRYFQKREREALPSNMLLVAAMRSGGPLPRVTIYPTQFFVNR